MSLTGIVSMFKSVSDVFNSFFTTIFPTVSSLVLSFVSIFVFLILAKLCPGRGFLLILKIVFYVVFLALVIGFIYPVLTLFGVT